jgi:hypothetical protein
MHHAGYGNRCISIAAPHGVLLRCGFPEVDRLLHLAIEGQRNPSLRSITGFCNSRKVIAVEGFMVLPHPI